MWTLWDQRESIECNVYFVPSTGPGGPSLLDVWVREDHGERTSFMQTHCIKSCWFKAWISSPFPKTRLEWKGTGGPGLQSRSNLERIFRKSIEKNSEKLGNLEVPKNISEKFSISGREHLRIIEIYTCWIYPLLSVFSWNNILTKSSGLLFF